MKLSAPLPPPPPPPPPGDGTGASSPGTPDEQPSPTPPAADASGSPAPAASSATKPATWPAWFGGVDASLVGLVLLFAFAAASFVARNTDVWVNLAAGKRLFAGEYFPGGGDPFSYAGRAWVNHSWLTDAAAYLLYGGSGKALVVAKALVVVLAFGVLIAIRRPKFPLWPWAACAGVAVLAAAPQFTLRPLVVSMLLLAVTLYLLFRMPQKKDSWRFPGAIGVTFWLWANCDQWFFLGPLALALLLAGDLIQKYGFNSPDEPDGDPDATPLGRLPDTATLAKALGIGVLACTLTPHHVRVWEPPFELVGASGIDADPRLKTVLLAPHDNLYFSSPLLGYNLNGLAYAVLFVAGAAVIGLSGGRLRVAHVALWLGFAALSLFSLFAVPFFALVAVPLVASQLNALSATAQLKTWGDPRTRLLLIGSSGGRIFTVLGVCLLCVLAYPGWVHPEASSPVYARRVAWGVEPDPALVQAAEQFKRWRETDGLPADARGVIANIDLANHVAWFAPQEKVFVNGRFRHHRDELADYVTVRRGLGMLRAKPDELLEPKEAADVLARRGADYVALSAGPNDGYRLRLASELTAQSLFLRWGEWSAWYTDGRTAVFGWRGTGDGRPSFAGLRLNATAQAFGPGVAKVPEVELKQPLAPAGWEEAFVRTPRPAPPGVAEAQGWVAYKQALLSRRQIRGQLAELSFLRPPAVQNSYHALGMLGAGMSGTLRFPPPHPEAEADAAALRAAPLLAVGAAGRAVAADPDHPDAYYALAMALRDPDLPLTESERALGVATALRQCLFRLPPPERYQRGQFASSGALVALELADMYLGRQVVLQDPVTKKVIATARAGLPIDIPGLQEMLGQSILEIWQETKEPAADGTRWRPRSIERVPSAAIRDRPLSPEARPYANGTAFFLPIDLARETLQLALRYAEVDNAGEFAEQAQAARKNIEGWLREVENEAIRYKGQYDAAKRPNSKLPDLVQNAVRNCLPGEALRLLSDKDTDLAKEYGPQEPFAAALYVALELAAGRVENAAELLTSLSGPQSAAAFERTGLAPLVHEFKCQKAVLAGEYKTAGELTAQLETHATTMNALLAEIAKAGIDPNKLLLTELGRMPPPLPGGGMLPAFSTWSGLRLNPQYVRSLQARQQVAALMQQESRYFQRRGELAILEGDIPAAKEWFKQARRDPPPGWRLGGVVSQSATNHLFLIEMAEKGK